MSIKEGFHNIGGNYCEECIIGSYCSDAGCESRRSCVKELVRVTIERSIKYNITPQISSGRINNDGALLGFMKSLTALISNLKSLVYSTKSNDGLLLEDIELGRFTFIGLDNKFDVKRLNSFLLGLKGKIDGYNNQNDPRIKLVNEFILHWSNEIKSYSNKNGNVIDYALAA